MTYLLEPKRELPKKKLNSPISRIVCWKCKRSDRPLHVIRDEIGKKTKDYVCDYDWMFGKPPIGNSSQIYFKYEKK